MSHRHVGPAPIGAPVSDTSSTSTRGAAFAALGLDATLVRALGDEGYVTPTPVQARAIPEVLARRDLFACAQTGTGKTAAFLLPILQQLHLDRQRGSNEPRQPRAGVRALVLSPTRELAAQIGERAAAYGKHIGIRHAVIYGGVNQRSQEHALRRGVDLLIATPGRLLDLVTQRVLGLESVRWLVLDEADRMLDMGFVHDVKRILSLMRQREQTLLFSATMPREIRHLAAEILRDPVEMSLTPQATAAPSVAQWLWHVPQAEKRQLVEKVLAEDDQRRAIVFARTKHSADRISDRLVRAGIQAAAIHGNKSQNARERALGAFRAGGVRVLVATDLAARGIDVDDIGLVVNYDLPNVAESYVHRIGRTGRAGKEGVAISFCDPSERPLLGDIERLLRTRIPVAGSIAASPSAEPLRHPPPPRRDTRRAPPRAHRA